MPPECDDDRPKPAPETLTLDSHTRAFLDRAPDRKLSLAEEAYNDLRGRLLLGELQSGVLMTEPEICELTGLGKAPVRAALAELRHDRLIDIVPRRGFFVRPWSAAESQDLMAARALLEPNVCALAARHRSDEDLAAIDAILAQSESAALDKDRRGLVLLDHDFHVAIAVASGNKVFVEMVAALKNRSHHQWQMSAHASEFISRVLRDHRAIRAALADRNPEAAEQAMRGHIGAVHQSSGRS